MEKGISKRAKQLGSQCKYNSLLQKARVALRVHCEFVSGGQGFEPCDCRLFLSGRNESKLSGLQGEGPSASSRRLGMPKWALMISVKAEMSGRRLEKVDCPADEKYRLLGAF